MVKKIFYSHTHTHTHGHMKNVYHNFSAEYFFIFVKHFNLIWSKMTPMSIMSVLVAQEYSIIREQMHIKSLHVVEMKSNSPQKLDFRSGDAYLNNLHKMCVHGKEVNSMRWLVLLWFCMLM
jgi:hypothetical protein